MIKPGFLSRRRVMRCLPLVLKAVLVNLFALGLALNLATLTSISWISAESYVIGLLRYCKGFDRAHAARHYVFYNRGGGGELVHKPVIEDVKCYAWNDQNRPSKKFYFSKLRRGLV